ncbi:MAG TPA: hypothetical protein DD730_00315 [Desulfosporosinus sp.]|jgi:hypothetical protein|nr:hypothetical protein [Desulfosporosinus sp.]
MHKKVLIVPLLLFMVVGCSTQKADVIQTPNFSIAADVRNDAVAGVTPEIEQTLLKSFLSDQKSLKSSNDFKRVVNSSELSGGTVFLVRTRRGFSTFFVEVATQKVLFVLGEEADYKTIPTGGISFLTIQNKEHTRVFSKVVIGIFNVAEATKAVITWNDGHQTTCELTNGTCIIEPKINEYELNQWEVFDSFDKSLYKNKIYN